MTTPKIRSTVSYWHEFPDGSDIKTRCFINDKPIKWHLVSSKDLPDNQEIEVQVIKSKISSVINTPIGGIPTMEPTEKKIFTMTFEKYKDLVVALWENGPEYFNQL
jgi:hypothetical protein